MKVFTRLLGFLVFLAPMTALAVWGVSYLVACLLVASAPGENLEIRLSTPGGPLTVTAATYAVDALSGQVNARNVRVVDPQGLELLSAASAQVSAPYYFNLPDSHVRVRARDARAFVERDETGRLAVLRYLEAQPPGGRPTPVTVEVEGLEVEFLDRYGKRPHRHRLSGGTVEFHSAANSWKARGTFRTATGTLSARALWSHDGKLAAEGRTDRLDLIPIWSHLLDLPESRDWAAARTLSARAAFAEGSFRLEYSPTGGLRLEASPTVEASGVRSPYWRRPANARFEGRVTERAVAGILSARDGRAEAMFRGSAAWGREFALLGRLQADAPSLAAIDSQYFAGVPAGLRAEGLSFRGSLQISGQRVDAAGIAHVESSAYRGETATNAGGVASWAGDVLTVRLERAQWRGAPATGSFQWNRRTDAISGRLDVRRMDLGPLARQYLDRPLAGSGGLEAIFHGTAREPAASFRADGLISGRIVDDAPPRSGVFEAAANLRGGRLSVQRLVVTSGNTVALASGWVDAETGKLDLNVKGVGIELADWLEDASGLATASLQVVGTLERPVAGGRVELFHAAFREQTIPILVSDVRADRDALVFTGLSGVRGASRLDGQLRYALADGALSGTLRGDGLQLSDFMGKGFGGVVSLRDATVGGTLEHPLAQATLQGRDLIMQGIRIDSVEGKLSLNDDVATLGSAIARAGRGAWTGEGWWNLADKSGTLRGTIADLGLDTFVPVLPGETVLNGTVDADTLFAWTDSRLSKVEARGQIADLKVNPTYIGNGSFTVESDGRVWTGNADIGQPERFVQVPEFRLVPETKELEAQVVAFAMPLRDTFLAFRPNLVDSALEPRPDAVSVPQNLLNLLDRLEGGIDASVVLSGSYEDPTVDIETLALSNIKVSGEPSGTLALAARRSPRGRWAIRQASWRDGPGTMTAAGSLDEHGDVAIEGDLNNFRPSWLALFQPQMGQLTGTADIHFVASGESESPVIRASIDAALFEVAPPGGQAGPPTYQLTASIGPILIREGSISIDGNFNARGITGGIDGSLPFRYPPEIPAAEPLDLQVSVPKRRRQADGTFVQDQLSLEQFADLLRGLEIRGDRKTLQANVAVGGTLQDLRLTGAADAFADEIAYGGFETTLRGVGLQARFEDDRLRIEANAKGGVRPSKDKEAGKVEAVTTLDLSELVTNFDGEWSRLWRSPVRGRIGIRDVRIHEIDRANGGELDVLANADVRLGGTVQEPTIATVLPATLQNLTATMPGQFPAAEAGGEALIEPRFNLSYVIATERRPARVRAATASFGVFGSGSVTGTLSAPAVNASLQVEEGTIRLPNARVVIEEGGTARFVFRGREIGAGEMRLDVNLEGRTSLSSVRLGGIVQRYDVSLAIRGNLLDESSQLITARSDPPDLDQAQILNLLGQRDLFEGLANQFLGQSSDRQLANTIAGVAIPVVFDPFTERIAQELGLEFLQLEYNAFEGATITAAKALGKGFLLQGRRQLTETLDNRINFDYRLTYRPPSKFKQLRNVIFSIGADQDRPWKISVEYGIRF